MTGDIDNDALTLTSVGPLPFCRVKTPGGVENSKLETCWRTHAFNGSGASSSRPRDRL